MKPPCGMKNKKSEINLKIIYFCCKNTLNVDGL